MFAAVPARAQVIGLTFDEGSDREPLETPARPDYSKLFQNEHINGYYNSDPTLGATTGSFGNVGPNYGVVFTNGMAAVDADSPALTGSPTSNTGNFENEPTPNTVLFWSTASATLTYAAGFDTGFSFYYSSNVPAEPNPATVSVWTGENGDGTMLGMLALEGNWQDGSCSTADGIYCNWDVGSIAFEDPTSIAKSIVFAGLSDFIGFDNVTFGSASPVPLPAAVWLLGSALLGFGALRRRQHA